MSSVLRITTPSRLHFGLLRLAQDSGRSFGGLGMMIDQPGFEIELQRSSSWQALGPVADRALSIAKRAAETWLLPATTAIEIKIRKSIPSHVGLGSGTQLALAIGTGMRQLLELPPIERSDLCSAVNRGNRSAIGTYGFDLGGMLWETGFFPDETLSPLERRIHFPEDWSVLLIQQSDATGLSGTDEANAFQALPPISVTVSERLAAIVEDEILPAAEQRDFSRFSEAVFEYGYLSGSMFEEVQGGPYASLRIQQGIDRLRHLNVAGVGQSSWGPTVFAFCPNCNFAESLMHDLAEFPEFASASMLVAHANNGGAAFEMKQRPQPHSIPV